MPPGERAGFLASVVDGPEERARLERELGLGETVDHPLVSPEAPKDFTLRLESGEVPVSDIEGQVIDRYRLLEKIGEGGWGVVYVAEQLVPVRRRVALKVIKLGMDTRDVVSRFAVERQALAMMDHPHIARVLDAGATQTGRPYFVMELVRGIRVTEFCDQGKLVVRQRLELFTQICEAIQHAHQKGIIHRDIKPSNILVSVHEGQPTPKVIDFGIAKATDQRLTDHTVYTQLHQFIGTPAYMSPEQAEMSSMDIDTRSDIYSLGVLLYELLTGRLPFSADELAAGGIDAIRRTIREREPVRPSTRIHNLDSAELRALALRRSLEPPRLIQLLKGDLDWIVMKCLEKDRTRRYATANGLALDIRRYLQHEPVLARPPSTVYCLRKAIRRNELVFASGTAVVLALMLGAGGSIWEAVRANRAEREQTRIWEKSQELARLETVARQAAITSKARAEWMTRQLRTATYAADVRVAQYEIEAGRPGLARELLGQYFPGDGDTADDYRGLEWRFLWTAACQEPTGNQDTASGPIMARLFQSTRTKDAVSATPAPAAEVMPVHSSDGVLTARHVGEGSVELKSVGPQPFQHLLPPGSTNVGRLALSGNGRSLAVAYTDGSAKIWTIDNSRVVGPVSLKNTDVTDMAFTADGKTLIASRRKSGVEFWNAETGRRMLVLDRVMPLFTPGKAIADGFEVEWQMNDGTRLSGFLSAPSLAALDADHHTRGQERP
jgi:serine/threonine protein kinase